MPRKLVPVILAGGSGTRLWPISRGSRPKQFLKLIGDTSLLQQTLERVKDAKLYSAPVVVTNSEYRFIVAEQAQEAGVKLEAILLEPVARNTAPAIAASAALIRETSGDEALMHILPSDHSVDAGGDYWSSVNAARTAAEAGFFATFGILPDMPATGYGYIECGEPMGQGYQRIARFVEKPDKPAAKKMIKAGGYLWNSGMFLMGAANLLDELANLNPAVVDAARGAVAGASKDLDFIRLNAEAFAASPAISIDYALFEKTGKGAVVPLDTKWSDLGSWDAVWNAGTRDRKGNLQRGPVTLSGTEKSLIISEKPRVVVQGLKDVAVLASDDAVYVGRLSQAQDVREIVSLLRKNKDTAALTETNSTSYRPWGGYTQIFSGERFQVKRLFVKPGKSLSLQTHQHRSEHWVVVRGTAKVQLNETVSTLSENESVYIPLGTKHRLSNPGKIQLELIEVQTGSYLGEDDIIRFEDDYGRN